MTFPDFMFRNQNKIPSSQQNTPDIEGYYYTANDGEEHLLHAGDELFIPKGILQGGRVKSGTRTIHAFGGKRISEEKND